MTTVQAPKPRVSSPIIFRAMPHGDEFAVRPCSTRCREYWLSGYIVASCKKCTGTFEKVEK